jgi:tetratricopeptide (TPR) repeat protein
MLGPILLIEFLLAAVLVGGLLLWQLRGTGPRVRRGLRRADKLRDAGNGEAALISLRDLKDHQLPQKWQDQIAEAEAACYRTAADTLLGERRYEEALEQLLRAAERTGDTDGKARAQVVEAMLAEARAHFAAGAGPGTQPVQDLLSRAQIIDPTCAEASFWQGMCLIREGRWDLAKQLLFQAREADLRQGRARPFIDPLLYLGALSLREGQPGEALRHLSEASRLDPQCPLLTVQLGIAMIAAGSDSQIALRALQRGLGPRGLAPWKQTPNAAWVQGLPENGSWVRRLAEKHPYACPLWGNSLDALVRAGTTAWAQGLYQLGQFQEAADLYNRLLQESAPTAPVLRGLGLSLTRLERYDQAFKHLRAAAELEEPKDPFTAGYLALCAALGTPPRPEDKGQNVLWAIRITARFNPGGVEWARICSRILAEARAVGQAMPVEDQVRVCDLLAEVKAADPEAAAAYHHLAVTAPEAVRPEFAWLFCRAAQVHGFHGERVLDLFARTFADEPAARAYYAAQKWDLDEVEYAYLQYAARHRPGRFPEALGSDYPARGERLLLARAKRLKDFRQVDAAQAAVEVLCRLSPGNIPALNWLAGLQYQRGQLDQACDTLRQWHEREPGSPWPLVRRAVVEQQRGQPGQALELIRQAMGVCQGRARAEIAFLGARLALKEMKPAEPGAAESPWAGEAFGLLNECLREDPRHADALWVLAGLQAVTGRRDELVNQAPAMRRPDVADPRFQYVAAVAQWAAGDLDGVLATAPLAAKDPALADECAYLVGRVHARREEHAAAERALRQAAEGSAASAAPARALLGRSAFQRGAFHEAVQWWQALDPPLRAAWKLDEPLQQAVFLGALQTLAAGEDEAAAEQFRAAAKFGLRDRRLGGLLRLALVKAGRRAYYRAIEPVLK